jgi:DNA anti-recombination protein RmuC
MTAIFGLLNLIPNWVFALITAGALATSCVQTTRVSMVKADLAETKTQFAERVAQAEEAARVQSEKYRAIEQELTNVQAKAETEAAAIRVELDRARAAGGVASTRLRNAAATAATAARADCTASASAELRETAARAARVQSDVFGELEQRARILGVTADERGNAGAFCQSIHEKAVTLIN